jgi:hypothetical protein
MFVFWFFKFCFLEKIQYHKTKKNLQLYLIEIGPKFEKKKVEEMMYVHTKSSK